MRALFKGAGWGFERGGPERGDRGFLRGGRTGERFSWKVKRGAFAPTGRSSCPACSHRWTKSQPRAIRTSSPRGSSPTRRAFGSKGSTSLVRPHEFLPFAEFFRLRYQALRRDSPRADRSRRSRPIHPRRTGTRGARRSLRTNGLRGVRSHPGRHRPRRRLPGQSHAPHALRGPRRAVRPRARSLRRQPRAVRPDARRRRMGRRLELAGAVSRRGPRGAARSHEADQGHDRAGRDRGRGRRPAPRAPRLREGCGRERDDRGSSAERPRARWPSRAASRRPR